MKHDIRVNIYQEHTKCNRYKQKRFKPMLDCKIKEKTCNCDHNVVTPSQVEERSLLHEVSQCVSDISIVITSCFSKGCCSLVQCSQCLSCFYCITYCYIDTCNCSVFRSYNRNFHLHCFYDKNCITAGYFLSYACFDLKYFSGCTCFYLDASSSGCCFWSCLRCCFRSCPLVLLLVLQLLRFPFSSTVTSYTLPLTVIV